MLETCFDLGHDGHLCNNCLRKCSQSSHSWRPHQHHVWFPSRWFHQYVQRFPLSFTGKTCSFNADQAVHLTYATFLACEKHDAISVTVQTCLQSCLSFNMSRDWRLHCKCGDVTLHSHVSVTISRSRAASTCVRRTVAIPGTISACALPCNDCKRSPRCKPAARTVEPSSDNNPEPSN